MRSPNTDTLHDFVVLAHAYRFGSGHIERPNDLAFADAVMLADDDLPVRLISRSSRRKTVLEP